MTIRRASPLASGILLSLLLMASDANAADACKQLAESGKTEKALECYRAVVRKNANDLDARNAVAALLAQQKKYQSALAEFDEVLKRDPRNGPALNGRGMMLLALDRGEEGAATLAKAVEVDPGNVQALHNLAALNARNNRFDVAVPLWQHVLTIVPDEPDALIGLGEILVKQGKLDEGLQLFNKVIEKDDRNARAIHLAGKTIAQARPAAAIPYFERVVLLAPEQPEPWYDLGLARMMAGEWRLAGQALHQARRLAPQDYRVYLELGKVNLEMRRPDDAAVFFDEVLRLNPPLDAKVAVRYHVGLIRESQGDTRRAADEYGQALKLDSRHVPSMLNLAGIHLEEKRWKEARETLERVLEVTPGNPMARFNLGKLLLEQGRAEEGKKELRKLLDLPESDPLRQEAEEILAGKR